MSKNAAHDQSWSVVELRQYTLRPGQRDVLIGIFDREFVETQEATGMRILGQFYDLDHPDRFVWMRGFTDMKSRGRSLTKFYIESETWKEHGPAANATMIDSTNALLLRPVTPSSGLPYSASNRPPTGSPAISDTLFLANVYYLSGPVDKALIELFERDIAPVMADAGAEPLFSCETESAENTFPRLPVRTGENVFVWFARFAHRDEYETFIDRLSRSGVWRETVEPRLSCMLSTPPDQLRLTPTARSQLR